MRLIPAVSLYVRSLLTTEVEEAPSQSPKYLVQSVVFPPHHSVSSTEPPRCRGFAFVVLDSPQHVLKLAQDYPWEGSPSGPHLDQAAVKFGLRALPNASWNILKEEYISYQQRLLSEAAEEAIALELPAMQSQSHNPLNQSEATLSSEGESRSSWYPQNCLVFVRNIHPGTNKTTLRALFQGFLSPSEGGVDYVDFNKGIDSVSINFPPARIALIRSAVSSKGCLTVCCYASRCALRIVIYRPERLFGSKWIGTQGGSA